MFEKFCTSKKHNGQALIRVKDHVDNCIVGYY